MSKSVRVDVFSDESEADLTKARNEAKGYQCTKESFSVARWDGTDLGGSVDVVQDVDGTAWLVICRK